jgi:exonuclease III
LGVTIAGNPIPSSHNEGEIRKLRALWEKVNIVTYNVESTRGTRMQELAIEAKNENVDILICIGTRGNYSGDGKMGEYKIYYEGHGDAGAELMTGIAILIHNNLLTKGTLEKKWVAMSGRILTVRLKNKAIDISIMGAYAPGDHLSREIRNKFWRSIDQNTRAIPGRSSRIIGIDANGHIGRDGVGGIGQAGQERWTNNGHELEKMVNNCRMVALNTLQNCRESGWTWQRRDGTGRGRIDYLLADRSAQNLIQINHGARDLPKWGTQGSAIDHRPVQVILQIKTLQEK